MPTDWWTSNNTSPPPSLEELSRQMIEAWFRQEFQSSAGGVFQPVDTDGPVTKALKAGRRAA